MQKFTITLNYLHIYASALFCTLMGSEEFFTQQFIFFLRILTDRLFKSATLHKIILAFSPLV